MPLCPLFRFRNRTADCTSIIEEIKKLYNTDIPIFAPADSRRIPRVPRYSGCRYAGASFGYGAITPCGAAFQPLPLAIVFLNGFHPLFCVIGKLDFIGQSLPSTTILLFDGDSSGAAICKLFAKAKAK